MVEQASGCLLCNTGAYCGCLSLRCLSKGLGGQKAYNCTMKWELNTEQKIIAERTDSFREIERNWAGEALKRLKKKVKCRIFLRVGGKCPALFRLGFISYGPSIWSTNANPFKSIINAASSACTDNCQGFTVKTDCRAGFRIIAHIYENTGKHRRLLYGFVGTASFFE